MKLVGPAIFSLHSRVKASCENIRGSPVELILLAKAGDCEGERGNGRTEKVVLSQPGYLAAKQGDGVSVCYHSSPRS